MNWSIDGVLEKIRIFGTETIGLALSGGGARGFAHVGVLKAFERFDKHPHVVSGVSAGAIVASLYGAGLKPDEIMEYFKEYSRFGDFTEWSIPKEGFFKMTKFARLLEQWLPIEKLEDMIIPTVICATDLDHGKSIGWASGKLVPRIVASCSIPVVFPPQKINGINYVDGGVLRNLPAWAIRKHCDILFGSNCSPLNRHYKLKNSMLDIALRSYQLMSKANTLPDLNLCDYIIQTEKTASFKTFELSQMNKVIGYGYDTACRVLESIYQ